MTIRLASQVAFGKAGQDSAFADHDRARDFATECWRRALHRRERPTSGKEA
jgi:hypothetical protein